jgi:hypothetical protein
MKYYKRLKVYKSSNGNNVVDLVNKTAFSYDWWQYLKDFNGKLVFNNYSYSSSTGKHQRDALTVLRQNNIKIDAFLEVPKGFQNHFWVETTKEHYNYKISKVNARLTNPRTRSKTRPILQAELKELNSKLDLLDRLTFNKQAVLIQEIRKL